MLLRAVDRSAPQTVTAPFDFTLTTVPLVRVKVGSATKYANLLSPDAAFGDLLAKGDLTPLSAADDAPSIVIEGCTPMGDTDPSNPAADMGCGMLDVAPGDFVPKLRTYEQIVGSAESTGLDTGLPTVCGGGTEPCG